MLSVPYRKQSTDWNCGPAVLSDAFAFFGISKSEKQLAREMHTTKTYGTSRKAMIQTVRDVKLSVRAVSRASLGDAEKHLKNKSVVIVNFVEPKDEEGHYATIVGVTPKTVILNDPWNGKGFKMKKTDFLRRWSKRKRWMMVVAKRT